MVFSGLTERERLIAEQAIETLRAMDKAADGAAHGEGMNVLEGCIQSRGFDLLRSIMAQSLSARDEAKKKGPASEAARAVAMRSSRPATPAAS